MNPSKIPITDSRSLAFIGGGNMARSLIGGLLRQGVDPARLRVAEPVLPLREALRTDFGVAVFEQSAQAVEGADTWVFAVKPQVMRPVCEGLAAPAQAQAPLVISIAAGITSAQIDRWLGGGIRVVRVMPNTPALLAAGASGLYARPGVDAGGRALAQALLAAAGTTVWIDDETQMDAVTALSGSGPAYVFLLAEAMIDAGIREGLAPEAARQLALQTVLGAGRMLVESGVDAAELRKRVTSPNGTTQAALERFEAGGLRGLVADAIHAARLRGAELSAAND
ncbi:pyrroline-5-carboxylate reductase [Thermomonas sp.]|uniref:pyrroline-5-carboxylate reductase n=1 Tax=Thermomonas sp. TaxID=1971895 RepID=UPI001D5D86FF|nr:pyrroline-5-carboxylate reductase [Thermomonas sp.]MBZ0088529.1 pyrroline-5-carboxylate reductase [Thermomonas sp.]MCO5054878.1 pyrroline-5-carboxylate reductase [Thermomonas sp.]HRO63970.1 pyrroline-5-carboxylate reductase [Thermomonas sp.]